MQYVSADRLYRAIMNLRDWALGAGQQYTHSWIFLASKRLNMNSAGTVEYRDSDDKQYWNRYMRLRGDDEPFYDPCALSYRKLDYPHNGAFKQRNDRWTAADYGIAKRTGDQWQFEANYIDRLRDKSFTKGNASYRSLPEPDVIAWLYRWEPFADGTTYADVRAKFVADFNLTQPELDVLFSHGSLDGLAEADDQFFTTRKVSEDLVVEMAKQGANFDMGEAVEIVAERSGAQPIDVDDVVSLVRRGRGQVILQGPPGTGKTYLARQVAAKLIGATDGAIEDPDKLSTFLKMWQAPPDGSVPDGAPGIWDMVQFHPSYNYEDFVRGISAEIEGDHPVFRAVNRTMAALSKTASTHPELPVVLIVDEINRGDLAKVLGELIFALEYRGEAVRTPYEVEGSALITIPRNILILATMNTADRSIALIDYAIRRRFDFVDLGASRDALERFLIQAEQSLDATERVLSLFDAVNAPLVDEPDYWIGQTYFMSTNMESVAERFVFQALPLLAEYRREGLVGENVRVMPIGWKSDRGIPLVPPRPFDLAESVLAWLTS
jgi:hypothetical protein